MEQNYVKALSTFGNVVSINKSFWGGDVELTPEDLGLTEVPDHFKLGRLRLMPKESHTKFTSIYHEANTRLLKLSFGFIFPKSRFVPHCTLPIFKREMEGLRTKFYSEVKEFKKNYSKNKLYMRQNFVDAAFRAYEQSGRKEEKNTFVNNFLERIEKLYPKDIDLDSRIKFSYSVYRMESPTTEDKDLQSFFERDLSSKIEKVIEEMVYEIREIVRLPFQRVATLLDEGRNLQKLSMNALRRAIKSFEALNQMVNDVPTQQSLNRFKAEILPKSLFRLKNEIELREDFRIRLEDIIKIVSHPKSHEIAIQEFKKRILRGNQNAQSGT